MRFPLTRPEAWLLALVALLAAAALFGPPLAQPAGAHAFADQAQRWGIPHALDVLTNLPFALAGLAGLRLLATAPAGRLRTGDALLAGLFFAGLLLTAAGSAWYHWQPDDAGLAIDRAAMAVAFAGALGLAAAGRVSPRAGPALAALLLPAGLLAVAAWSATGNVLPWAVVQFGGAALLAWMAVRRRLPGAPRIAWWLVLAAYALAKLAEVNDHALHAFTGGLLSGHNLKHLLAAAAALPVLAALGAAGDCRQNGPQAAAAAAAPRRA